ncbi:UNVERIFIED_CONTAM: hypothetical protein FKN15_007860 [Acipenser sinensis]
MGLCVKALQLWYQQYQPDTGSAALCSAVPKERDRAGFDDPGRCRWRRQYMRGQAQNIQ